MCVACSLSDAELWNPVVNSVVVGVRVRVPNGEIDRMVIFTCTHWWREVILRPAKSKNHYSLVKI